MRKICPAKQSMRSQLRNLVTLYAVKRIWEQDWHSDENTRLPPTWPGVDSLARRHMWVESSIGDGGSSAFLRNCAVTKAIPYTTFPFNGKLNGSIKWFPHFALTFLRSYFCARILKLYVLPIESAFKYSPSL